MTQGISATSRIPMALQQIFLASQKGEDVQKISAPSNGMGFKIFKRGWGKKQKKQRPVKAPTTSSLSSERSGSRDTAADASRKAIKERNQKQKVRAGETNHRGGFVASCIHFRSPLFPFVLFCRLTNNHHKHSSTTRSPSEDILPRNT